MKTKSFLACVAAIAAALAISGDAFAQQDVGKAVRQAKPARVAEVTLVGRGNQAAEIGKDGNVTELTPDRLVLRNRGRRMSVLPVPSVPEPAKQADQPNPVTDAQKAAKAEGEKAVQDALKEADVNSIEEMRKNRYMWFFDEAGNVMTEEELDRRIAEKDVAGIKAVNDDRDEWTPRSAKAGQE